MAKVSTWPWPTTPESVPLLAKSHSSAWRRRAVFLFPFALLAFLILTRHLLPCGLCSVLGSIPGCRQPDYPSASLYGVFPRANDPFHFLPCTNATTVPPPLDDPDPIATWAALFQRDSEQWSWGSDSDKNATCSGRAIFLCGFLDMPLDHHNASDGRIVRLAMTKLQVAGLSRLDGPRHRRLRDTLPSLDCTSERTIVLEPGGPGASGTSEVWVRGEKISQRLSSGQFDVLGFDPRGVNISLPSASCFTHDSYRDHWSLYTERYREASASPAAQLEAADAMNDATFYACRERFGEFGPYRDFGRFLSTTSTAMDMEGIRQALDEDELSGYLVSYGTSVGQTYAGLYPDRVGRLVLDGNVYVKDTRTLGLNQRHSLANVTAVWRDGFLRECIEAGPENCALAQPRHGDSTPLTTDDLESRMDVLIKSLIDKPVPAYLQSTGPMLITYSEFVKALYPSLYLPTRWAETASMLRELERGNATAAAQRVLSYHSGPIEASSRPISAELTNLVVCADAHESLSNLPESLAGWDDRWANYTAQSWLMGNYAFSLVFPCKHFPTYWQGLKTFTGDLNQTALKTPLLLLSSTFDPSTPLRHGRRILDEMGTNARLVVHHGYGHATLPDKSNCTDQIAKTFMMEGKLPEEQVSRCWANEKPFRYSKDQWF